MVLFSTVIAVVGTIAIGGSSGSRWRKRGTREGCLRRQRTVTLSHGFAEIRENASFSVGLGDSGTRHGAVAGVAVPVTGVAAVDSIVILATVAVTAAASPGLTVGNRVIWLEEQAPRDRAAGGVELGSGKAFGGGIASGLARAGQMDEGWGGGVPAQSYRHA